LAFAGIFADASRHLSETRSARAQVQQSPSLAPEEKRKRLDNIDKHMAGVARHTLKLYDGYKRQ
jgi:hypothetical protein